MRLFGWSGKFYFPEIEIRWPKKNAFDHGNHFTLLFSLQSISRKWERERERAHARERRSVERDLAVARLRRWSRSRLPEITLDRDRDRRRERKIRDREISYVGERGRSKIAIDASRDRVVDRDLAFTRSRRRSQSREEGKRSRSRRQSRSRIAIDNAVVGRCSVSSLMIFFWVVACVFLDLCFLLLFQTPENIFRKIFWNATKHHGNIFLFRKLAFRKICIFWKTFYSNQTQPKWKTNKESSLSFFLFWTAIFWFRLVGRI